ncbi:4Fe-4S binding protein [Paenibacillus sp. GCM10023252]|uniref:4Fe-4S binding protein n=1 Tax=Paenibacillus sp. GCM10023252 TaxID=3252649 RepID=UPI003609B696
MIEILSKERCVDCNQCVSVCPTNVFDPASAPGEVPTIARKSDCQTCFMCELYCPTDALFVSPLAEQAASVTEPELVASGLIGSYRDSVGWGIGRKSTASSDGSYVVFRRMQGH